MIYRCAGYDYLKDFNTIPAKNERRGAIACSLEYNDSVLLKSNFSKQIKNSRDFEILSFEVRRNSIVVNNRKMTFSF